MVGFVAFPVWVAGLGSKHADWHYYCYYYYYVNDSLLMSHWFGITDN